MSSGWVLIWREMFESGLWLSEPFTRGQAWVDLILLANHAPSKFYIRGREVKVGRGQIARSETALAERWQWSRGKVRRYIQKLETVQQIVQQKNRLITLITITNYNKYQPVNGKVIQQNSKSDTSDSTTDGTTDGTYTKKVKKVKKVKKTPAEVVVVSKDTWITPYSNVWLQHFGGEPPYGRLVAAIKSVIEIHGEENTLKGWKKYCDVKPGEFVTPQGFAQKAGIYINPPPPKPLFATPQRKIAP